MSVEFKATLAKLLYAAIAIVLAFGYFSFHEHFPYYFIWDMDHTVALDTLLIQSHYFPDHLYHPGFGINFLLFFTQKIAFALQKISVLQLADLYYALNPYAGIVEWTQFNRAHSPLLALAIVLLLWSSLQILWKPPILISLLLLLLLGTQESLFYHSTMIRTEFFSIFYWSASLFFLVTALSTKNTFAHFGLIGLGGIFAGLTYLTKIQSLIFLLLIPALSLFFASFEKSQPTPKKSPQAKWIVYLSFTNWILFTTLILASWFTPIPKGFVIFESTFQISPVAILFFLTFLGLFYGQVTSRERNTFLVFFTVLTTGFLAAFLLHFLLYQNPLHSLAYMLYDFKMVFLRKMASRGNPLESLIETFTYHPALFLTHILLFATLLLGHQRKWFALSKRQTRLCSILTLGAFLNTFLATRFFLRDLIWSEILFNFLNLSYLCVILKNAKVKSLWMQSICIIFLASMIGLQIKHVSFMTHRLQANYNLYGWQEDRIFQEVYAGNQLPYRFFMNERYDEKSTMRDVAKRSAKKIEQIKKNVSYVFQNQHITLRNIGIVSEQYPIWNEDLSYHIQRIPEDLREATLINSMNIPVEKKFIYQESELLNPSERLDKINPQARANELSLLNRNDLQILLFVTKNDYDHLATEENNSSYSITISKGPESEDYYGLSINHYTLLPTEKMTRPYFFVIREI